MAVFPLSSFLVRPRLMAGVATGLATAAALHLAPGVTLRPSTLAILAWDAGAIVFITTTLFLMATETESEMRRRADRQDEGRGMILVLATLFVSASLAAIAVELSAAQQDEGWARVWRVALGVGTDALSRFSAPQL